MNLLKDVFPLQSEWLQWPKPEEKLQPYAEQQEFCILYSEKITVQSSILFQLAVSGCSSDSHVLYITQEPLQSLPKHIHGMPTAASTSLSNLKILYMKTSVELTASLAEIHCGGFWPDIIIVENLQYYINNNGGDNAFQNLARLCALISDSAKFTTSKSKHYCKILCSVKDPHKALLGVCRKYSTCLVHLSEESPSIYSMACETRSRNLSQEAPKNLCFHLQESADSFQLLNVTVKTFPDTKSEIC